MKGYRTLAFNILSFLAGAGSLGGVLPPSALPYIALATAIGNVGLRFITDTPVGSSVPKLMAVLIPLLLVGTLGTQGCSATTGAGGGAPQSFDLVKTCQITQVIFEGAKSILDAECAADTAKGKDPLKNPYCLSSVGGATAVAACFAAADKGDVAGVARAKADVTDAASTKPAT